MSDKWYYNDWFISFVAVTSFILAAVSNYYIHGGQISW